jgi:hypothetical protein
MIDGVPHRMRRGKLVPIPPEWVGQTVGRQTIHRRPSKQIHKLRKATKLGTRTGEPTDEDLVARELREDV